MLFVHTIVRICVVTVIVSGALVAAEEAFAAKSELSSMEPADELSKLKASSAKDFADAVLEDPEKISAMFTLQNREEDAKKQWKKKRTGALRLNAQLAPQLAALRTTERAKGAS